MVTIGSASHSLDGTNVQRQTDQLIAYTRTATQTATPTNIYGAEIVVTNGQITSINDRLVTGGGATPIPSGSTVLSGHDRAREWLIANAKVGSAVTLPGSTPPTTTATPGPTTTTTTTPSTAVPPSSPPNTVTVGTNSHPLNGVNVARQADQLVQYTRTATQTATPTNIYGAEIVVTNGRITSINDRLVTRGGATAIPVGAYVLSGHDAAREWLLANARTGLAVGVPTSSQPSVSGSTTPTASTTTTATTSAPASGGLPAHVSAMWWHTWQGPTLSQIPADVTAINNVYIAAMAQSAGAGTGNLGWGPTIVTPTQAVTDIAAMRSKGKVVLLGIGGSSDGGITVLSATNVDEFVNSVTRLVNQFHFDGIDLDLEPSGSKWNQNAMVSVASKLKAKFGADFVIGLTVAMYGEHTASWLSLARALGSNYDYWAPMLYDFPEAHDGRLTNVALGKVRQAVAGGVPANKQILGFMCNAYYNTSPVQVTMDAYNAVKAEFPTIRGAFIWESGIEAANNYSWSRMVGKAITS